MHVYHLAGPWQALASPERPSPQAWKKAIEVQPGPWQRYSALQDARTVWYRAILVNEAWKAPGTTSVILTIPSFYATIEVFWDGYALASSDIPYLPLTVDISALVATSTSHELLLKVGTSFAGDSDFDEMLHGKQDWYSPAAGVFGPIILTQRQMAVPPIHWEIDTAAGMLRTVDLQRFDGEVTGWLHAPDGSVEPATFLENRAGIVVRAPQRWSLESPILYTLNLHLRQEDTEECLSYQWGFREIRIEQGCILLNDRPIYLHGALDQDYWPSTIVMAPDEDVLRSEMMQAKALGLNLLRCHIKPPDPRYLTWADRLGLLVWEEIPSFGRLTPLSRQRVRRALHLLLERDRLHPSFALLTIANEDWGPNLARDESARQWLKDEFLMLKQHAGNRLIIDNSPCFGGSPETDNFHVISDVEDFHRYLLIPDAAQRWSEWLAEFATHPAYTFSPTQEARRQGNEPLVVSEFGQWGLPNERGYTSQHGHEPAWFSPTTRYLQGLAGTHGARERFTHLGLERIFGSYDDLVYATQQHQCVGLAYAIEEIRRHPAIRGYVMTEWTDVEWEANGLLDMRRQLKPGLRNISDVLKDHLLILRLRPPVAQAGDQIEMSVEAAWVKHPGTHTSLAWRTSWGRRGTLDSTSISEGITTWETLRLRLPQIAEAASAWLECTWYDSYADVLDRKRLSLTVVDQSDQDLSDFAVTLLGEAQSLSPFMPSVPNAGCVIATDYSEQVVAALQAGRRVVIVSPKPVSKNGKSASAGVSHLLPVSRAGTIYDGNWISTWHYLDPRWSRVENPLGMPFMGLLPEAVIPWSEQIHPGQVLSGTFTGWIDRPTVTTYHHQNLTITTFPLIRGVGEGNPLARRLLVRLLRNVVFGTPSG